MSIISDHSIGRPDWQGPPWLDSVPYDDSVHLIPAGQTYQSPNYNCAGYGYIGGLIGGVDFDGFVNFDFNTNGPGNTSVQSLLVYTPPVFAFQYIPLHVATTGPVFDISINNAGATQAQPTVVIFGTNRPGSSPFGLPNNTLLDENGTILNTGDNFFPMTQPWGGVIGLSIFCTDAITWNLQYYAGTNVGWNTYLGAQPLAANTQYYQQIAVPPAALALDVNYAGAGAPAIDAYAVAGFGVSS